MDDEGAARRSDRWRRGAARSPRGVAGDEGAARRSERPPRDAVLLGAARRAGWVLAARELRALGLSRSAIQRRLDTGLLVALFHGVYLVGRTEPTRGERQRAGLKACDGLALGRRSAAVAHGVMARWDGPVEVCVARPRRRQRGLVPLRRDYGPEDVTWREGVPVTTLAVTLCDLAEVLSPEALDRVVHEAEFRRKLDVAVVARAMARRPRRPGYRALRAALAKRRRLVDGRLDSKLERRFHAFLEARDYPPSEHNVSFDFDDGGQASVDVLFRAQWLAVEVDGGPHQTVNGFHADRRRDRRLEAEWGLMVLRVTEEDIDERPDALDAELRAALARRG